MLKKIITYIIPINLMFDISLAFFEKGGVVPMLRAIFMLCLLVFFLIKYNQNNKFFSMSIIFSVYVLITCLFSSDILRSLSISLKIIISILSFSIGFGYFNSFSRLKILNHANLVVLVILLFNFILSTLFGIGYDTYTGEDDFLAGNLSDSWNIFTYSLMASPLLLLQFNKQNTKKILIQSLLFTNLIIMVLSLKRIAVIGVLVGGLIYGYFNFNLFKHIKTVFIVLIVLISTFPIYQDTLLKRFDSRSDRFQKGALEEEARYMETGFVWSEIARFENPIKVLFGLEGFNSVGNYADGKFGDRNLHIDYNLIANTVGIVGLILYIMIFVQLVLKFYSFKIASEKIPEILYKPLKGLFWAMILTQFVTSFSGQMYLTTFRMIIFIYLGAILGIMYRYSKSASEASRHQKDELNTKLT